MDESHEMILREIDGLKESVSDGFKSVHKRLDKLVTLRSVAYTNRKLISAVVLLVLILAGTVLALHGTDALAAASTVIDKIERVIP